MPFFQKFVISLFTVAALSRAAPLDTHLPSPLVPRFGTLTKRTNPIIGQGIDVNDHARGGKLVSRPNFPTSGAFSNAQQMLSYVLFTPGVGIDSDSPIFSHYFKEEDRAKVKAVIAKLAGNPATPADQKNDGAAELGQITFQGVDTPNNGDDAGCEKEGTRMYTEYYDTSGPVTVVCEDAWVFPDRDDVTCQSLGDNMGVDMAILGTVVLHEYSHWDWFLSSITHGQVTDTHGANGEINGYGLDNVYNNLDKALAPFNADSYAWYGTEVLWSVLCSKTYGAPDDSD